MALLSFDERDVHARRERDAGRTQREYRQRERVMEERKSRREEEG